MSTNTIPAHSDIDPQYTWNAPSLFPSDAAWDAEYTAAQTACGELSSFAGRLAEGPAVLLEAIGLVQNLLGRVGRLRVYATMAYSVDTTDGAAAKRNGRAGALGSRFAASMAFLNPELLAIGEPALRGWLAGEPRLAFLAHYVDDLFRRAVHVRSAEVEEVLGLAGAPLGNLRRVHGMLADADFVFPPARGTDGATQPVTQGTLGKILAGSDREARRTAWEGYHGVYLAHKNTLAATLSASVAGNVFNMRVRRHANTLEMALFEQNLPPAVYHNLLAVFRRNLPTWQRYWRVRRTALGVAKLYPYDMWAPLAGERPRVPFDQAVDLICDGLAPLGGEYVAALRRGCLEQRWADVYPCRGKAGGAFSTGAPGSHPFIMMSYTDEVFSLSTLAHELGHSMHSYLSRQHQPPIYSRYGMFAAETASNFHQAMLRGHLLATQSDPAFQLALLEETMSNFLRYFFIMPTLARFELEVHEREERSQGMSADDMIALMADLFAEGYGGEVEIDRPLVGMTWATFGHLYVDYYVFQYATGISAANALAGRIRGGAPGAVDDYLRFLSAGSSLYPLDALKLAGVDMTSPEPVEAAFGVLADMVARLEGLVMQPVLQRS